MEKILKKKLIISKKGNRFIFSDKNTGKPLFHVTDSPTYAAFDLDKPILSGVGSLFNVAGNYYSFRKYLANNDDSKAMASDWEKVGMAFLDALSVSKNK